MKKKMYYPSGEEIRIGDKIIFEDEDHGEAYVMFPLFPNTVYGNDCERESCLISLVNGVLFQFPLGDKVYIELLERRTVDLQSICIDKQNISVGDTVIVDSKKEGTVEAIIENPYVSMVYGSRVVPSLLLSLPDGDYSLVGVNGCKIERVDHGTEI